jgi:glucose/arabinose dehydrogenase
MKELLIFGLVVGFLPVFGQPQITDPGFTVEEFIGGIPNSPTTMAFVGENVLVLQKSDGQVRLIKNGILQNEPVLDVAVNSDGERGMLGITTVESTVYLYFTESVVDGGPVIGNRIYRYDWDGIKLANPALLKTLPGDNFYHNGGAMTSFADNVFAVIGDNGNYGKLQNKIETAKNDTSVILRVEPPGPYYAIGIRNSFGIDVDPQTGILWDTENGLNDFDEINMVPENFNSGWIQIMGPATNEAINALPEYGDYKYSDPEFSWQKPVAPTAISFSGSESFGQTDRVFVGDCNNGNIYRFKLNSERTGFVFDSPHLSDLVLNVDESADEILFGSGFGCLTDIEEGPDGFLYAVSLSEGKIFRIVPKASAQTESAKPEGGGCLIATATYGTELAPQVQMLREIRSEILGTSSGAAFLSGFNSFYYSFSPVVSDLERQNPVLKETIRTILTPLLLSVSLLGHANTNSDHEMLAYETAVILLNLGMYFVLPAVLILRLKGVLSDRKAWEL